MLILSDDTHVFVLQESRCVVERTLPSFCPSIYCQEESTSLNAARYEIYRKKKNPPPVKSPPPNRREPGIARAESPIANDAMEDGWDRYSFT